MRRTGASRYQLLRWAQQGYIPGARVVSSPTGRGRRSLWPEIAVENVKRILAHGRQGVPLSQSLAVSEVTKVEVEAAEAQAKELLEAWRVPLSGFKKIRGKTTALSLYQGSIEHALSAVGLSAGVAARIARKACSDDSFLTFTLSSVLIGQCPVLLYSKSMNPSVMVVPDYLVSHAHSTATTEMLQRLYELHDDAAPWSQWGFVSVSLRRVVLLVYLMAAKRFEELHGRAWPSIPIVRIMPSMSIDILSGMKAGSEGVFLLRAPARVGPVWWKDAKGGRAFGFSPAVYLSAATPVPIVAPDAPGETLTISFSSGTAKPVKTRKTRARKS